MKLKDLMNGIKILESNVSMDTQVGAVAYDSRKVTPGSLFVAVTGFATDGNRFIPMALEKGAVAVVTAAKPEASVPYVLVESDRLALAALSANWFSHPGRDMTMIGITGTNGKTSATLLLRHVLQTVKGAKVGLIGTMENCIGDLVIPTERTTPESYELQELFQKMRSAGCKYVVMEVSSHALSLERVGSVEYEVAAFTNLTEDHLDFHKTMEAYCDAKAILFRRSKKAVLNCDDPWCDRLKKDMTAKAITTSVKGNGDLCAKNIAFHSDGVSFDAVYDGEQVKVSLQIPGKFTVYNALTVLGICMQLGISLSEAARALTTAKGVKGRVEVVPTEGKDYTVLIDYAHTPDGLENVLSSVKDFCRGRLISVFGCGGDRDRTKRPIMGEIGAKLSDIAIITSDNPRTEVPSAIIDDILTGVPQGAKNCVVIENRIKAIHHAMDIAEKDDIIVLAGKGHETYQEICGEKHHLDEREVVAEYLQEV